MNEAVTEETDITLEGPVSTIPVATDPEAQSQPKTFNAISNNKYGENEKKHLSWFGHGKLWTCLTVMFAWVGCCLAVMSRLSTNFVHLERPFEVSPQYQDIHEIGMIRIEICLNTTMMMDNSGCEIFRLNSRDVDDNIFNLSRSLLGLATALGFVLSLMLTTSIYWESINLKPIGVGFLVTYFFQSFSMLFFDTDLCSDHSCKMGTGGILCIIASICWMVACVGTAKMDSFKLRAIRARRKAARKKAKAERKARKELRKKELARKASMSASTISTDSTTSVEEGIPREIDYGITEL